jgi:tetratricopeptide (TPR) repeat protein
MDADLATHARVVEELGQPFYLHTAAMFSAAREILCGDFAEAERQAHRALHLGRQIGTANVSGVYGIQMFSIRREQGRLGALAPLVQHFVQQNPASATWRPGLALIYGELGLAQEARTVLEELAAGDFASIPRDAFLASTLAYLGEVCAALHDAPRAALLYPMLLPYDGLAIVAGFGIACYGAASRFLGLLAMTLSRWDEAERHFVDALEMSSSMGARPWLAHTQHQYAAMLLARGCPDDRSQARALLDAARRTASELGMEALHEKAVVLTQTIPA